MGIGPNNLGPDGKAGYTSCGHPQKSPLKKMDSSLYMVTESLDGSGQPPLAKFEDQDGDGQTTQKDVLIARGVLDKDGNKI